MNIFYELFMAAMLLAPIEFHDDPQTMRQKFWDQKELLHTYAVMYPHRNFKAAHQYIDECIALYYAVEYFNDLNANYDLVNKMALRRTLGDYAFIYKLWPEPINFNWE